MDPGAGPGHAYPYEGNYSTYLENKASRIGQGAKDAKRRKRLEEELSGALQPPGPPVQEPGPAGAHEEMAAEADKHRKLDFEEIQIPPGPRLGNQVVEIYRPDQGLRGPGADRRAELLAAPQRAGRVIGPNGVGKTTLFKMLVGDEQPDWAASISVTPSRSPTWTS